MKIFQVTSAGFGRELFEAETAQDAITAFNERVNRLDKLNGNETSAADAFIRSVRLVGTVVNRKP